MQTQVMLLNVLKYEKNEKKGTRIGLIFAEKDSLQETPNFKGYKEIGVFYDGHEVFSKIPKDFIGRPVTAYIKEITNPINPLKKSQIIATLEYENNSIDLL